MTSKATQLRAASSLGYSAGLTLLGCLLAAYPSAGQEPPIFRATAEIVRLQVAVFDDHGQPVTNLERSDFTVRENGQERALSVFLPPNDGPLEVALLMDISGSMSFWDSRPLFHAILDGLPSGSCVLLIPFDERVRSGLWGHPDDIRLRAIVDGSLRDGLAEAVYDALVVAFSRLRERAAGAESTGLSALLRYRSPRSGAPPVPAPGGDCTPAGGPGPVRRAVVILTDQVDSASRSRLPDAVLASWGSRIPIFALAVTRAEGRGMALDGRVRGSLRRAGDVNERRYLEALRTLSQYTGGFVVRGVRERTGPGVSSRPDIPSRARRFRARGGHLWVTEAVERLVWSLRSHYVLGFAPVEDPETGGSLVVESEVEVRVAGDDLEVLTAGQLVRGEGKSEGAALDLVLRGFGNLAAGRQQEALREFDAAVSMAPGLGLAHYGRAIALASLGHTRESLSEFVNAREYAPWLPDIDARLAAGYLETGDPEAAWGHALRAHYRGSDVSSLLERLQQVAPRDVDLDRPPENPRVAVRAGVPSGIGQAGAADRLVAIVWNLAAGSDVMHGGWAPDSSDLLLRIELRNSEWARNRFTIRGRLMLLDPDGEELASQAFTAGNVLDLEATAADLEPPFRSIEAIVRSFGQPPDRRR